MGDDDVGVQATTNIVTHTYLQRSKLIFQGPVWHSQKSVTMILTSVYALLQYMQHTQAGLADTVPYNTHSSDLPAEAFVNKSKFLAHIFASSRSLRHSILMAVLICCNPWVVSDAS